MAEVKPFRGILYNPAKIKDMRRVVAPPYDVISPEMQDALYERHPQNVIRLILGKESTGDGPEDNKYKRSGTLFRRWLQDGTLTRDSLPGLYVYEEEYSLEVDKPALVQRGLIAAVKIEEYDKGTILPHEDTMPGPKRDRLALMRECRANLSPIFGMYSDPGGAADTIVRGITTGKAPRVQLTDDHGIHHRIWSTYDDSVIQEVSRLFAASQIFIADGHHRYETAMAYRNETRPGPAGEHPSDYVMMWLVNMDTQEMTVLPTHRVIGRLQGFDPVEFLAKAQELFSVARLEGGHSQGGLPVPEGAPAPGGGSIPAFPGRSLIAYLREHGYYLLTLRDDAATRATLARILGREASTARGRLDVTLLHNVLIGYIMSATVGKPLGTTAAEFPGNLVFTRDAQEGVALVRSGQYQAAFFLSPAGLDEIREVVHAGDRMPQKSTYFYPKPLSGLVFRDLSSF